MQENELRSALLALLRKLVKERDAISRQIQACDTMLATLPAQAEAAGHATAAAEDVPPAAPGDVGAAPALAPLGTVGAPPVPPPVQPPALSPEARAALVQLAGTKKRGAIEARVELAVAECGDTFSLRDVLKHFQAMFGLHGFRASESVGSSLWKLARKRGYRIVREGTGTLPTLYVKSGPAPSAGDAVGREDRQGLSASKAIGVPARNYGVVGSNAAGKPSEQPDSQP